MNPLSITTPPPQIRNLKQDTALSFFSHPLPLTEKEGEVSAKELYAIEREFFEKQEAAALQQDRASYNQFLADHLAHHPMPPGINTAKMRVVAVKAELRYQALVAHIDRFDTPFPINLSTILEKIKAAQATAVLDFIHNMPASKKFQVALSEATDRNDPSTFIPIFKRLQKTDTGCTIDGESALKPGSFVQMTRPEPALYDDVPIYCLSNLIGCFNGITELNLSHNYFYALPQEICLITSLKVLNLKRSSLHTLPSSLHKLIALADLHLEGNAFLKTVPKLSLPIFTQVTTLTLDPALQRHLENREIKRKEWSPQ